MIVLGTQALLWWVSRSGRRLARANRANRQGMRQASLIASAITVLEIVAAVRRGRLELGSSLGQRLADMQALPELRF